MKKLILVISGIALLAVGAMGCSRDTKNSEKELINKANALIENKYNIEIDENDYTYDLGGAVEENQFTPIKEGEIPSEVFLRAVNKGKPSNGKVFDYSIKFNTKTDEILSSDCLIYQEK